MENLILWSLGNLVFVLSTYQGSASQIDLPVEELLPPPKRRARKIEAASTSDRNGTSPEKLWSKRFSVTKSGRVKAESRS